MCKACKALAAGPLTLYLWLPKVSRHCHIIPASNLFKINSRQENTWVLNVYEFLENLNLYLKFAMSDVTSGVQILRQPQVQCPTS
jgi:hypothetical protein